MGKSNKVAMNIARNHALSLLNKAEREDDGPLFTLAQGLLNGELSEVQESCSQLVASYDDCNAKNILQFISLSN